MICEGCGIVVEGDSVGPTHPYILASPECWKIYEEVLVREYSDANYWKMHRLTVDAYSCQHPGDCDPRAIQSVTVHLVSLFLVIEKKASHDFARYIIGQTIEKHKKNFKLLERPKSMGKITAANVLEAKSAEEHEMRVTHWAQSVWEAWKAEHAYISKLVELMIH